MKTYLSQFMDFDVRVVINDDDIAFIPVVDIEEAIEYTRKTLYKMVIRTPDIFAKRCGVIMTPHLYQEKGVKRETETLCLTREGVVILLARLEVTRIKNPEKRQRIIQFIDWVGETIVYNIDRGILKHLCPVEFHDLLSCKGGDERSFAVQEMARRQGVSPATIYRKLRKANGGSFKKNPRKGSHLLPDEYQQILKFKEQHPQAFGTEIKRQLRLSYSRSTINNILLELNDSRN